MVCSVTAAALSAGLAVVVRARLAAGGRVTVLARRAGLSQSLVSNWLQGRRALSIESLDLLRIAVGAGWCELAACESCPSRRVVMIAAPAVRRKPAKVARTSRAWAAGVAA